MSRRLTYTELEALRKQREDNPKPRSTPGDIYRIPWRERRRSLGGARAGERVRKRKDPRDRHGGLRGLGVRTHEDDHLGAAFLCRALGGSDDGV